MSQDAARSEDPELLAHRAGVAVRELDDDGQLPQAVALLDAAEADAGSPLVDEAERHRLEQLAAGASDRGQRWRSLLAWAGDDLVGYGAVVLEPAGATVGDAAIDRRGPTSPQQVLAALLAASVELVRRTGGRRVQVWTRHAGQAEVDAAAEVGFEAQRRLAVLGRSLPGPPPVHGPPSDAVVRSYRPGVDDEAAVAVLAAAYEGTGEAGWDLESFRERTRLPWFRPEDLLVAALPDDPEAPRIAGLHWLKRRDAAQGEVYNLAVHPAAQGRGLGPVLLHAGLSHLRAVGCDDVLLWVDLANGRAVRLYEGQGFEIRWQDLALGRDV